MIMSIVMTMLFSSWSFFIDDYNEYNSDGTEANDADADDDTCGDVDEDGMDDYDGDDRDDDYDDAWRRSGSAVECRTLDRENTVTNPLPIGAVDGDSLWRCYTTTKQNHCTCTLQ